MPNVDVEEAGRSHVYALRTREHPVSLLGSDAYLLGPILERLDSTVADLLEYCLDVAGGVDGLATAHTILRNLTESLPGASGWLHPLPSTLPSPGDFRPDAAALPPADILGLSSSNAAKVA